MMTPSASAPAVIESGDNVFQICFTDPNQGVASADYIAENKLGTKVGIIYDSSDAYSSGIYEKFKAEAAAKNLRSLPLRHLPLTTSLTCPRRLPSASRPVLISYSCPSIIRRLLRS